MISKGLKNYLRENRLFNNLLNNAGKLLGGETVFSILAFISVAITARALGPELFGILVLIRAYTAVIDSIVNFQSWQALIKYGAEALEKDQKNRFKCLLKFGSFIDIGSAIAGTIISISGAYLIGYWQGWEANTILMISVYSGVILFNWIGTPIAILRLYDKFGLFAVQKALMGIVQLTGVLVAYISGSGLWGFLLAWLISTVFGRMILFYLGWREIGLADMRRVFKSKIKNISKNFQGLWSYIWTTNFNRSLKVLTKKLDTIVVGYILGVAAAGIYDIAKKFAKIAGKLSSPLYQVIYPEFSKLWAKDKKEVFITLGLQSATVIGLLAFLGWIIFLIFGNNIILIILGGQYAQVYSVLIWYLLAIVVAIFAFPLQPAMLAMGYPEKSLYVHLLSTVIYFAAMFPLLIFYGLPGAGMAYLVYYILWSGAMFIIEYRIVNEISN